MDEESGAPVSSTRTAGRPEFVFVVNSMVGAWRRRVWRNQPALREDCIRRHLALAVPANSRRAFLACEYPDRNRFRFTDVRVLAAALEEGPREWPSKLEGSCLQNRRSKWKCSSRNASRQTDSKN